MLALPRDDTVTLHRQHRHGAPERSLDSPRITLRENGSKPEDTISADMGGFQLSIGDVAVRADPDFVLTN